MEASRNRWPLDPTLELPERLVERCDVGDCSMGPSHKVALTMSVVSKDDGPTCSWFLWQVWWVTINSIRAVTYIEMLNRS